MSHISINKFSEVDLKVFLEMTHFEYGSSDTTNPVHIKWKHMDSPFGASSYVCLSEVNEIIGRVLVQPRPLITTQKVINAASVMDLLIDSGHRSTPTNFLKLTKASSDEVNYELIYHTSNERTYPLYSKLLKYANPFCLKAYGLPVRISGFLNVIFGRRISVIDWLVIPFHWLIGLFLYMLSFVVKLDISKNSISDAELEGLSNKCLRRSGPHLTRTNVFLKWRFCEAPLWPADIYRIDRNGRFLGYLVTRVVQLGELNHFVLMDFFIDPDTSLISQFTIRLWLILEAIKSKADDLFTITNPSAPIASKFIGFPLLNIPDRFLPHNTPIFIRPLTKDSQYFENEQSIHFTLADLDYF
jgi:hypothetical protein